MSSNSDKSTAAAAGPGFELVPLREAADAVMAHQWSNNREAMDALTRLVEEAHDAQTVLGMVADVSQSGGLALQSPLDALVSVRRLTLEHWNTNGSESEHRARVLAAVAEARRRGLRAERKANRPWPQPCREHRRSHAGQGPVE